MRVALVDAMYATTQRPTAAERRRTRRIGVPAKNSSAEHDHHQHHRGAEVVAEQHEPDHERRDGDQRHEQVLGLAEQAHRVLAGQQIGAPDHERELGRLGRLDREAAEHRASSCCR